MSKGYIKDSNGKYKLVEKDNKTQEPVVLVNQQQLLSLETLDARIKRLESLLLEAKK